MEESKHKEEKISGHTVVHASFRFDLDLDFFDSLIITRSKIQEASKQSINQSRSNKRRKNLGCRTTTFPFGLCRAAGFVAARGKVEARRD